MIFVGRIPAHDLAEFVFRARVRAADRGLVTARIGFDTAVGIVGQGAVRLNRDRVHGNPFRPVHRGGPQRGRRLPGVDQRFSQRKAGGLGRQRQPFPGHVIGKFCGVKLALVQQGRGIATRHIGIGGDIFIQKLTAFIIAKINHNPPVARDDKGRVFVLETAKGCALYRHRCGIAWVNLDHIAKAVGLVRGFGQIKAGIELFIGIAAFKADAVALKLGRYRKRRVGGAKVGVEVFFAGKVGAPRRAPCPAIVHRAQH